MKTHSYNWLYAAVATAACIIGGVALVLVSDDLSPHSVFGKSLIRNALFRHPPDPCGENPGPPSGSVIPHTKQELQKAQEEWNKWLECANRLHPGQ